MQKLSTSSFYNFFFIVILFLLFSIFLGSQIVSAAPYGSRPVSSGLKLIVNNNGEVGAASIHDTLSSPTFSGHVNNYAFMMDEQLSNEVFANVDKLKSGNAGDLITRLKNAVKSGSTLTDKHKVQVKKGSDVAVWAGIPVAMCENSDRNVVFITVRAFYNENNSKISDEATIMGMPCKNYREYITQKGTKKVLYSLKMYMPGTSSGNNNNNGTQSPPDKPINVLVMSMDPNVSDEDIKNKYTPMVKSAILGIPVVAGSQKYKDAFGIYECLKANCKYQEGGTSDDMTVQVPVGADLIVGITLDGISTSVENVACPAKSSKLVFRTRPDTSTILHEFGHAFACLRHPTSKAPSNEEIGIGACVPGSQPNTCKWGNGAISYNTSNCLNSLMAGAGTKFCQAEEDLIEKMINVYLGNTTTTSNLNGNQSNNQSSATATRSGGTSVDDTGNNGNSNGENTDGTTGGGETGNNDGSSGGSKNSRFPVMVKDGTYSGVQPQDFSYAWFTDGSLGYKAGNEPRQSVIDSKLPAVISRIKNKIGSKMLMVSDVDTLGKILPKYKNDLVNAGIEYIGYDMEISPPGTEQEEKDSRNNSDPSKNALVRAAKLASANGFKLVWGSIFVSTIDISEGVMKTAIDSGLWGIAFQMQNQWDNPKGGETLLNTAVDKYRGVAKSISKQIHITTQLMTDGKNCLTQGNTVPMNKCSDLVQKQIEKGNMDSFSIWAQGGNVSEEFLKAVLGKYYTATPSGVVADSGSGADSGTGSDTGNSDNGDTGSGSDGQSSGEYTQDSKGLMISNTFCNGVKSRSAAVPMRYLKDVHPKNKLTILFMGKGYAESEVKEMCVDAVIAANVIGMDSQYGTFADKYEPYFMEVSLASDFYWDNMGEIAGEFQQVRYGVKADIMIIFAKDGVIYKPGGGVQGEYSGNGKQGGYSINAIQGVDAIPDIWTNRPVNSDEYKIRLRHELGHFFGLGHIDQLVYSDSAWGTIKDAINKMVKGEMNYNWEK